MHSVFSCFFFFNDTATTEIYTLSLHDALPISAGSDRRHARNVDRAMGHQTHSLCKSGCYSTFTRNKSRLASIGIHPRADRKSTRLNSSHLGISYAVFCLKKKKKLAQDDYSVGF